MKRRIIDGSSTVVPNNTRGARRLVAVGMAILAALLLVLTIAVRPVAFADSGQGTSMVAGGQSPAKTLVAGQVADSGSTTVLVYLNGSDLESQAGEATSDIAEMLESKIGAKANVVIETLGTSKWQNYGIASDHTQRYVVNQGKLELVDDSLGQLDTTDPNTLADFISWGVKNYPADRYILVLWDHGAGPVYGFGYDEFQSEGSAMTLDEMKQALDANPNVHFDIIGMDCCIMGSLETCVALQPYCDYMVVSEDFEPGVGWSYEGWMSMLEQNPGIDTVELGKVIVDDMIADVAKDKENGEATLALIDESAVDELYGAWVSFAYANEDQLLGTNYSQETEVRDRPNSSTQSGLRVFGEAGSCQGFFCDGGASCTDCSDDDWERLWEEWDYDDSYVTMTDYFVTDIMQVASSVDGDKATALESAFDNAMVHFGSTSGEVGMSGLGVTLPYSDGEFYDELTKVFKACGIDGEYVDWLEAFVDVEGAGSYYNDYGYDFGDYGYDEYGYDDNYGYYDSYDSYGYGHDGHGSGSGSGHGYQQSGPGASSSVPGWPGGSFSDGSGHHHRF